MTIQSKIYDDIVSFMIKGKSPEEIIKFKPAPFLDQRVAELIQKKKDNSITEIEARELEQYMWLEHLMRLAKASARNELKL